jgi:hypothetical protein
VFNDTNCAAASSYTFPVFTYPHGPECAVMGGYVYRGDTASPYYGYYFFVDYCTDMMLTLHYAAGNWIMNIFGIFPGNNFCTFGENAGGQLFVAGLTIVKIFRVIDNSSNIADNSALDGIKIIQNPISDNLRIETGRTDRPLIQIILYDVNGKTLYNAITREANYEIGFSFFPAGTYFLNIMINGKKSIYKLIRAK